jgi:hypothetical protein
MAAVATRQRHTHSTRTTALALLRAGRSVRAVAGLLNVPRATVMDWKAAAGPLPLAEPVPIVPDVPQAGNDDAEPPFLDRTWLEAYGRYVSLIASRVPHGRALAAAQVIDEDFEVPELLAARMMAALQKDPDEAVRMAERFAAAPSPPGPVQRVYERFEMTDTKVAELAAALGVIHLEAFIASINGQLAALGVSNITSINDSMVTGRLIRMAEKAADGIAGTYNRDLATEVYASWVEYEATVGTEDVETMLEDDIVGWTEVRADWKAFQVSLTEAGSAFILAARLFRQNNPRLRIEYGYVTPDECSCDGCQEMVSMGRQRADVLELLPLPLHPGCEHDIVWEAQPDEGWQDDMWTGQGEGEEEGFTGDTDEEGEE